MFNQNPNKSLLWLSSPYHPLSIFLLLLFIVFIVHVKELHTTNDSIYVICRSKSNKKFSSNGSNQLFNFFKLCTIYEIYFEKVQNFKFFRSKAYKWQCMQSEIFIKVNKYKNIRFLCILILNDQAQDFVSICACVSITPSRLP